MSRKLLFLSCVVLAMSLVGNVLAADIEWDNDEGAGDRLWKTAANWDTDTVPAAGDWVLINDTYVDDLNGPIINADTDAVCEWLDMGSGDLPAEGNSVLTMTGGTLTTGDWVSIGDAKFGDYRFDLSDGNVTIGGRFALGYAQDSNATFNMYGGYLSTAGDLFLGVEDRGTSNPIVNINGGNVVIAEDIELAEYAGASGTININGGTIEVGDNIYVGWEQTGPAIFNMTGGTVTSGTVTGDWIYVGGGYATNCYLNLDGGTLSAPGISLYPDVTLNISGGTLILDGDYINVANGWIWDPCEEDWNGTLTTPGVVTVYGTSNYGIIDDANYPAELGKRAVLLIDYDVTNPGKTTVMADAIDADLAWNEKPSSGSAWQPQLITLSWSPGLNADLHNVYFGTSLTDVNTGTGDTLKEENLDINSYSPGEALTLDTTYYWRIDEVNDVNTWKGLVWNFKVAPGIAINPSPADEASAVSPLAILSWTPGSEAYTHELYFSTDFNDVNDRLITPETPEANSYDHGFLGFETTYYWAVDEVNLAADVNLWPGDVWSFTTSSYLVVDDFESYDFYTNLIWDTWIDGWINWTGAEVFLETQIVRDGNSMRLYYDNEYAFGGSYGSWTEAFIDDLQIGPDWTAGGARILSLWFYGDAYNSATINDRMYLALNDGVTVGVSYYPDVNDIKIEQWQQWNIDLNDFNSVGVDMANVTKISIGFGTYGGSETAIGGDGRVCFDDIRLYSSFPNTPPVADAGPDQTVYTDDVNTAQVTLDGSGSYDPDGDELTYAWFMYGYKIATGANPTGLLPVGEYTIQLIVNDGQDDSVPDQVVITVVQPAVEAVLEMMPGVLNCRKQGEYVNARLTLPEGYLPEDVDLERPVVLEPAGIESVYVEAGLDKQGLVVVEAVFERLALCEELAASGDEFLEITATGHLTDGQCFYGTSTIEIK